LRAAGGSARWTNGGELVFAAIEVISTFATVHVMVRPARSFLGRAPTTDDNTNASGRGCAALGTTGRLVGHIFMHKGDDSGFVAERE
jgi:hypothetical protein